MLIPRPHSFLANSAFFWGGVFFAWLEGYGSQSAGSRLNMPVWLFALLWFLVQEVLVQQAKYMLNDMRDHERDQKIPANRGRPIARRRRPATNTAMVMAGRWALGLVLAGLLSPHLLVPIHNELLAATLLLVVLSIDHRLNASMDYKQQNLIYLMENRLKLRRVALERPGRSRAMIHWRHLLQLALSLDSAGYESLRERQKGERFAKQ